MKFPLKKFPPLPKALALSAFAAALTWCVGSAQAQSYVSYGTTFDNLIPSSSLSGQDNWDTTDLNQSDYVGVVTGYSATATDYWAGIGGFQQPTTSPGTNTPNLFRPYSLGTATVYAFNVDFGVSSSQTPYPTQDAFGWSFQNAIGTKIFSFNIDPTANTSVDAVRFQIGTNAETPTGSGVSLNAKYHLAVSVNITAGTVSASLVPLAGGATIPLVTNAAVSSAALGSVVETAATWTLSNSGSPGSNGMFFNNYFVTIPEPSTWAMLGVGACLAFVMVRRRVQA